MTVVRVVLNVETDRPDTARVFYEEIFDMTVGMDHGWIVTLIGGGTSIPQISFASEGGSGTPVPDISIEVDNLDEVLRRLQARGHQIEYGPADEPWGVRRFFVRDPFGRLLNVLAHA